MKSILDFLKNHKYFLVILILCSLSIVLSITYSSYFVESNSHRAAEMYIGELKYSMTIEYNETNTLTVPSGETIIDLNVNNLNPVDTYYKLLYLKNSNIEIKYFSETKDTDEVKTSHKSPNDSILKSSINNLKLLITNKSTTSQNIGFTLKGGYINNTLSDISIPNSYSEITTLETPSSNTYFCKTDDTLTQGLKYVKGQYTYGYKQQGTSSQSSELSWNDISTGGWGVQLTDKTSTELVTAKLCTYINNAPVVSMAYMFYASKATAIDLSSFDTHNVTSMSHMFNGSQATTLDLSNFNTKNVTSMGNMFKESQATTVDLSNFDTSNVKNMYSMFEGSQATTLDLSNFNTKNVTNMYSMFKGSQATILNLSNFDTSKITNMNSMFKESQATVLDLSNFDTSNVTHMNSMFNGSQATSLNLSNFDTGNVTSMSWMFSGSKVTSIDLSSFDTNKVTDMSYMFRNSKITALDLSSFDTSKVTDMSYMFQNSNNLKTIYVSSKFNTTAVTSSSNMFTACTSLVGGTGTKYNSSYIDKTYARIDGGTSNPGYFTDISAMPSTFDTDDWATIAKSVKAGNRRHYKAGDTRTIDLGSYGTHTVRVANTSTPTECNNSGFSKTACGFVLEFSDLITTYAMNKTETNNGGWPAMTLRTFLNNDILNALPNDLKSAIIDTTVVSGHNTSETQNYTSTDKIYLLSTHELYGDQSEKDTAASLTRQLDYYKASNASSSSGFPADKDRSSWWTRTISKEYTNNFYMIDPFGIIASSSVVYTAGVSPAFRIG